MSVTGIGKQAGFTIVELLIVIVVIAILAAISIVAYTGVQDRSRVSAVHSDLSNVKKKLMLYDADKGSYPTSVAELMAADISIGSASNYENRSGWSNFYYCSDRINNTFALGARVVGSGVSFYVTSSEGITPQAGLISSAITCNKLGLASAESADGAYSAWGISATGVLSNWLRAGN